VQRSHHYSPVAAAAAAAAAAKYLRHEPHHHQRRLKPLTHSRETATETQFLTLRRFRAILHARQLYLAKPVLFLVAVCLFAPKN